MVSGMGLKPVAWPRWTRSWLSSGAETQRSSSPSPSRSPMAQAGGAAAADALEGEADGRHLAVGREDGAGGLGAAEQPEDGAVLEDDAELVLALAEVVDGADGLDVPGLEGDFPAEGALAVAGQDAEGEVLAAEEERQVLVAVAVEVGDVAELAAAGGEGDGVAAVEGAFALVDEDLKVVLAGEEDVGEAVVVEVLEQEAAELVVAAEVGGGGVGEGAVLVLVADAEAVDRADADDVGAAVAVEVGDVKVADGLVDDEALVDEAAVELLLQRGSVGGVLAEQDFDAGVAVVGEDDVGAAVGVDVLDAQAGAVVLELVDLLGAEAEVAGGLVRGGGGEGQEEGQREGMERSHGGGKAPWAQRGEG